ncbi:hypothetical protein PHYBLDRAFT_182194 [Phycomyces blakesleeanus NRRL 1555(-)]|uniref:Uncharacterized protein n=1 Tax=Phycomyces blakesleeanus (strain ATCC 8743b / DSM 1359 / FGSC 10004 / NBRC 33097 / NRRL 1555) TaxID=763407 RepID=A0A167LX58_PHYB8|nr:hypothetical protein PHYBLDRAFT_182194 [Phycomyces blakesleeanus NRRL 1555(-)]OAD71269.1 hypothetical protein PHYBLDRAFT_182194 [Phycomyces blakesleeanus NRRL 1555(-)]|eukprot:XP_018289309.1 hypothetical protein PHYBLDRAFT_182194 [Phycomyces blakesleeanus NRRL 1555(-)]
MAVSHIQRETSQFKPHTDVQHLLVSLFNGDNPLSGHLPPQVFQGCQQQKRQDLSKIQVSIEFARAIAKDSEISLAIMIRSLGATTNTNFELLTKALHGVAKLSSLLYMRGISEGFDYYIVLIKHAVNEPKTLLVSDQSLRYETENDEQFNKFIRQHLFQTNRQLTSRDVAPRFGKQIICCYIRLFRTYLTLVGEDSNVMTPFLPSTLIVFARYMTMSLDPFLRSSSELLLHSRSISTLSLFVFAALQHVLPSVSPLFPV